MPEVVSLSMTAREKIVKPYLDQGIAHEFRTTPISSVGQLVASVVQNTDGISWIYFAPQKVKFFRKGEGDRVDVGAANLDCTEAESNLQRAGSTDGARDMAIEGLQVSSLGTITQFYEPDGNVTGFGTAPSHEGVVRALRGQACLLDPFGLVVPSQLQSPYLLEDALFSKLMQLSSLELALDTSRPFKLGGARLFPGTAGQSMLKANGVPDQSNKFLFPEGILWKRDGKSDSDLKVTIELHREIAMPITPVVLPGGADVTRPIRVYQRVALDILGVSVSELGDN